MPPLSRDNEPCSGNHTVESGNGTRFSLYPSFVIDQPLDALNAPSVSAHSFHLFGTQGFFVLKKNQDLPCLLRKSLFLDEPRKLFFWPRC